MTTYTLTFGDCSENHAGMQINGFQTSEGFSVNEIENIQRVLSPYFTCVHYDLSALLPINASESSFRFPEASILTVHNFIQNLPSFLEDEDMTNLVPALLEEQEATLYDTKAFMYGRVVNKQARYNICFGDWDQEPDYSNRKGRIVDFAKYDALSSIRKVLPLIFGEKARKLQCEGNKYYDIRKCYIGWHGDSERKIVIGLRLGDTFPLYFQWYRNAQAVSKIGQIELNSGDLYVMSEKATGNDWKKRNILTLRHAAASNLKLINKK